MSTRRYNSIFYHPIPVELWMIIYKFEHKSFISSVNREIKKLANEVKLMNERIRINSNLEQQYIWTIHEMVNFKKKTGAFIDTEPGEYQGTIIYDAIDFAGHEPDGWAIGI